MSLSEFFYMGGYWPYVWPSYALATVVLAGVALSPVRQRKQLLSGFARKARRARTKA
jgi:heme exporter protein CcmD